MTYLKALLVLLLALVLAGFIQQNGETTIIHYFGWNSPALPLSLFIVISFAAGYLLALLLGFTGDFRSRIRLFKAEREVKRLKKELMKAQASDPEGNDTDVSPDGSTLQALPSDETRDISAPSETPPGTESQVIGGDDGGEGEDER